MAAAPHGEARLRRDGPTLLVYAQLSLFAYFLYAFAPSVTLLRDEEHVGDAVAGLHGTVYAAGVVTVATVAQRVIAATGRTRAIWLFLACLGTGIVIYASVPLLALTLVGALVCGAGASGVAITVAPLLLERHGPAGPAAVTEANGVAATVGLLAPLAIGGSVALGYGWRPALLLFVVAIAVLFAVGRLPRHRAAAGDPAARAAATGAAGPVPLAAALTPGTEVAPVDAVGAHDGEHLGRQFWLSCAIVVSCVGLEFCMTLWSAQLLRDRAGLTPAAAATGVTAIVAGMSTGRLLGARVARRRSVDAMLGGAFVLTAIGFGVFWLSTVGWLSFAGLALCGLGMALHYPLGVARSITAATRHADLASSRVTLGGGLAIGAAPFLLGLLGDLVGVRDAFLLVPVLLVTASATLAYAARDARRPATAVVAEPAGCLAA